VADLPPLTFPTVNCVRMPETPDQAPEVLVALEDVLRGVAGAGFDQVGIDVFTLADYLGRGGKLAHLAGLLTDLGLRCSDVGPLRIAEPEQTLPAARQLAEAGAVLGAPLCLTAVDADPEDERTQALLARCADGYPGRLALEFLPYTVISSLSQAKALCAAVGWDRCGLLVDSWMFFHSRGSWPELLALSGDEVAYVQVNDAGPPVGDDLVYESRHRRLLPGAGDFDLNRFVGALRGIGFTGPVSVEVLSAKLRGLPPVEQAEAALASVRQLWVPPEP
jgi:sugar phosphate isomerase/epimerase